MIETDLSEGKGEGKAEEEKGKGDFITKKEDPQTKTKNSEKLYLLFGKVIISIAELNGKLKILHGDIRPENIMIKFNRIGDSSDVDLEPEIMNFDLMLENNSGQDLFDPTVRYQFDYRSPEMSEKIAYSSSSRTYYFKSDPLPFKFSQDFVEDVYALGKTIRTVLTTYEKYLDTQFYGYKFLNSISDGMTSSRFHLSSPQKSTPPGMTYKKIRPNMKALLKSFTLAMKGCADCKDKTPYKNFIARAERSLLYIPDLPILI